MRPESFPQSTPPEEQQEVISEKLERIILPLSELKDTVISQLGSKATIERLDITEINGGLMLSVELDAGFTGGHISIKGEIVNTGNEIAIQNLNIEARGYVKSRIESSLSVFTLSIKKYFEKKYSKPVSSISIRGSNLVLDLENSTPVSKPTEIGEGSRENLDIPEIIKDAKKLLSQNEFDNARLVINRIKDEKVKSQYLSQIDKIEMEKWMREAQQLVYQREFDQARVFVTKIKDEEVRNRWLKSIDKIETDKCKEEAQDLVYKKRYDDARGIIRKIKDENVKNRWLQSIDEIESRK